MSWLSAVWNWVVSFFISSPSDPRVLQVQALAERFCKFLPTAESILAMLTAANPAVVGAEAIATAICQVVTRAKKDMSPVRMKKETVVLPGKVNGIVVEGKFV